MSIDTLKPLLIFGKNGQVAQALAQVLSSDKYSNKFWQGPIYFLGSDQANFLNPNQVLAQLQELKPSIVINASAYTAVDKAETETQQALQINAVTPGEIAKWCRAHQSILVHYSTDYVFSSVNGSTTPLTETDPTGPSSYYGQSKLNGEQLIQASGCQYFIFRTSWVYSYVGANFVKTMLRLGADRQELKVVSDQWGSPTYAMDIADATIKILNQIKNQEKLPTGIYHLSGSGYTNWHLFAEKIFQTAKALGYENALGKDLAIKKVLPIPTSEYPTPATRPLNSRMSNEKLKTVFQVVLPKWEDSLQVCIEELIRVMQQEK